jgi:hypothetical protein
VDGCIIVVLLWPLCFGQLLVHMHVFTLCYWYQLLLVVLVLFGIMVHYILIKKCRWQEKNHIHVDGYTI